MNEWNLSQQEILSLVGMEQMEMMMDALDDMREAMEQEPQTEEE